MFGLDSTVLNLAWLGGPLQPTLLAPITFVPSDSKRFWALFEFDVRSPGHRTVANFEDQRRNGSVLPFDFPRQMGSEN